VISDSRPLDFYTRNRWYLDAMRVLRALYVLTSWLASSKMIVKVFPGVTLLSEMFGRDWRSVKIAAMDTYY